MILRDITEKFGNLDIYQERHIADDYVEIVFYNRDKDKWHSIFSDILGPALKPSGINPSRDILNITESYGGIYKNQTLFKREFNGAIIIAMFWPWQDGEHTTLKMASLEK